jgi:transposase InsO family protein
LSDRSVRYANQLPQQIEGLIVTLRRDKPHWGARKIRELLVRRLDGDIRVPAKSTIHAVLHRHGLVKPIGRARRRATGTPLSAGAAPNELWCADFKGEFKLGNGLYCYPLTVTDHASRFLLLCEALESTCEDPVVIAFEQLFQERGLPHAIRSDNGVPFASPNALFNLSKLAVWWLRLGISIERIKPGHPQQNGQIERTNLNAPSVRPLVASDDLSCGQCVGTQLGADRGTRCGVAQRQLSDFYCVHGNLVVVRVVADWRARTAVLRKPEIVTPLARACGQIP